MPRTADQTFDESFLELRAKLLEIAATLDRVDRVSKESDSLLSQHQSTLRVRLDEAMGICLSEGPDRAERLQRLFSRPYESTWRSQMQI